MFFCLGESSSTVSGVRFWALWCRWDINCTLSWLHINIHANAHLGIHIDVQVHGRQDTDAQHTFCCTQTLLYPGQKKSFQPRYSWGWSAVRSCDIELRFDIDATRGTARRELALQIEVDVAWYHMIALRINLMNISAVTIVLARVAHTHIHRDPLVALLVLSLLIGAGAAITRYGQPTPKMVVVDAASV